MWKNGRYQRQKKKKKTEPGESGIKEKKKKDIK